MRSEEFGDLYLVNVDQGEILDVWTGAEVKTDFLTPCDEFTFTCGVRGLAIDVARKFPQGSRVILWAEGGGYQLPILDGYVDSCKLGYDRQGGTKCVIKGRDFLRQVVDSNVDPRCMKGLPPKPNIMQVVDFVLNKQFGIGVNSLEKNDRREQAIGPKARRKRPTRSGYQSRHRRSTAVSEAIPYDNEGAFAYLSRLLKEHGYWIWAARSPDAPYVVVDGPDFDTPPVGKLIHRIDGPTNNILKAELSLDETDVPSHVYVRGSSFGPGDKAKVLGAAVSNVSSMFRPLYAVDPLAKTPEAAERIAKLILSKQLAKYAQYECTVAGLFDRDTTAFYDADMMIEVEDESLGVSGLWWIKSRTYRLTRDGAETDLVLVPPGTLLLDYQPDDDIDKALTYAEALAEMSGRRPPTPGSDQSFFGVRVLEKR